jgi:hypothetical protein
MAAHVGGNVHRIWTLGLHHRVKIIFWAGQVCIFPQFLPLIQGGFSCPRLSAREVGGWRELGRGKEREIGRGEEGGMKDVVSKG